jgi:hypothetical protein
MLTQKYVVWEINANSWSIPRYLNETCGMSQHQPNLTHYLAIIYLKSLCVNGSENKATHVLLILRDD